MSTVRDDLERFHSFAAERLAHGGTSASLSDLFDEWSDIQARDEINDAIRRGLADVDAGRHEDAVATTEAVCREIGLDKP